jgi:hypothetical protein
MTVGSIFFSPQFQLAVAVVLIGIGAFNIWLHWRRKQKGPFTPAQRYIAIASGWAMILSGAYLLYSHLHYGLKAF